MLQSYLPDINQNLVNHVLQLHSREVREWNMVRKLTLNVPGREELGKNRTVLLLP